MTEVKLSKPVQVDGAQVDVVQVIEPTAGALRGLKTFDLIQMDVTAHFTLLPRVTQPPLTAAQLAEMRPADFTRLQAAAVGFLVEETGEG